MLRGVWHSAAVAQRFHEIAPARQVLVLDGNDGFGLAIEEEPAPGMKKEAAR